MDKEFVVAVLSALGGMFATLGTIYIALRTLKPNLRNLKSQETSNLATAAETYASALVETLKGFQNERADLEKRIDELEAHREERTRRIEELEKTVDNLTREVKEMDTLRKQIAEGEAKYQNAKRVIEILVQALKDANIPLPSGVDLSDSHPKLKAVK